MESNTNAFSAALKNGDYEGILGNFRSLSREEQRIILYPLLTSGKGFDTLHKYFKRPGNADPFWIELFSAIDYNLLISAIRVNGAFLGSHFDSLASLGKHPELYVQRHYTAFCQLRMRERELFDATSVGEDSLLNISCEEWLWHIAFWMEFNKAYMWVKDQSGAEHPKWQQPLVWAANHFLSDLVCRHNSRSLPLTYTDSKDLPEKMFAYYERAANPEASNAYFKVLDSWYQWYEFMTTCLDTYCYDLNFEVQKRGAWLVFTADEPEKYYQWQDNGLKQQVWLLEQLDLSLEQSDNRDEIIQPPFYSIEREIKRRALEAELVANYYYLSQAPDFPIEQLLKTWHKISGSALGSYVMPLDNAHRSNPPAKWAANVIETCKKSNTRPVISTNIDELKHTFRGVSIAGTDSEFTFIKRALVQEPTLLKPENYNRFKPFVNFFSKPLLALGNRLCYLPAIAGESSIGVGIVQNLLGELSYALEKFNNKKLHEHTRSRFAPLAKVAKSQTDKMEEVIAGRFSHAGFKDVAYSRKYSSKSTGVEGEIDCLVYESGVLLIIEVKRTQLRGTLEGAWDEKIMSLGKAAQQLDKDVNFLKESFGWLQNVFDDMMESFEELEIKTLIVSTSFEHDHEFISDRHLKVSLYELDKVLDSFDAGSARNMGKNPVSFFYDVLRNNELWKNLPKHTLEKKPEMKILMK